MMFAQDSTLVGDVDCSGDVNSEDASLILQFVTNVIDELPCQDNMTGLTPEQLQEIINMVDEQLSISYGGSGSDYPIMISSMSNETMTIGDAFVYCNDLEEDGNTDWFLPNLDQLLYAISGGCEFPDERTDDFLWSTTSPEGSGDYYAVKIESGYRTNIYYTNSYQCRCVRFEEGETSEGSSGSSNYSGSGSSILGNSEQPITMIGPMYLAEDFPEFNHINSYSDINNSLYGGWALRYIDALRFCGSLNYNGYDDWFLPSLNQILHFLENNDTNYLGITNLSNLDYSSNMMEFWTSSDTGAGNAGASPYYKSTLYIYTNINSLTIWDGSSIDATNQLESFSSESLSSVRTCFCVR